MSMTNEQFALSEARKWIESDIGATSPETADLLECADALYAWLEDKDTRRYDRDAELRDLREAMKRPLRKQHGFTGRDANAMWRCACDAAFGSFEDFKKHFQQTQRGVPDYEPKPPDSTMYPIKRKEDS